MHADELALTLKARRSGRQWLCRCPAHEDGRPSLIFWQGERAIRFKCYAGCTPTDILKALIDRGALPGDRHYRQLPAITGRQPKSDWRPGFMRRRGLAIWNESEPAEGALAERYLSFRRGLGLELLTDVDRRHLLTQVVRFHPACPYDRDRAPALVILMRSIATDEPQAIQRIFLDSHARKLGSRMLGPAGGAAMKLDRGSSRYLVVAEGFETALACRLLGDWPVWALGSAETLRRLPPIAERLTIRADHDKNGVGQKAALACQATWRAAGREVGVHWPAIPGQDYADFAARALA